MPKTPHFAAATGLNDLSTPGYIAAAFGEMPSGDSASLQSMRRAHSALTNAWHDCYKRAQAIEGDETKTAGAKLLSAAAYAKPKRSAALVAAEQATVAAAKEHQSLLQTLRGFTAPPASAGQSQVAAEIRAHFKSLSAEDRGPLLENASDDVLHAVVSGPAMLSGIASSEMHERLTREYLKRRAPDVLSAAETLHSGLQVLTRAQHQFRDHVNSSFDFDALESHKTATGEDLAATTRSTGPRLVDGQMVA